MYGEPSLSELIESVALYLEKTALPALSGHAAFHGRVAINALNIAQREAQQGEKARAAEAERLRALLGQDGDAATLNAVLCENIRAGRMGLETPGLLAHMRASLLDRLAIEQPGYASYRAALEGRPLP